MSISDILNKSYLNIRQTYIFLFLVIALSFVLLSGFSLILATPPGYAIPIFPAAGFALVAMLHYGPKVLPAIWFGSLIFSCTVMFIHLPFDLSAFLTAIAISTGAALQALVGRLLVIYWLKDKWKNFESERDIVRFLIAAGPVACLISATVSSLCQFKAGMIDRSEIGFVWLNWFHGDTLGVVVLSPLMIGWLYRKNIFWSGRLKLLVLPTAAMLTVTSVTFSAVSNSQFHELQENVVEQGQKIIRTLDNRIVALQEVLTSLASFIEVTPNLDAEQFSAFSESIIDSHPDIAALSFNLILPDSERHDFEQHIAQSYANQQPQIMERDKQGILVSSPPQHDYVVVAYIAPFEQNAKAIGFNINSEPTRRDAIERSKQSGQAAVTAKINLVQDNQNGPGVLVLTPVKKQDKVTGFAVGVVKVNQLIEIASQGLLHNGIELEITDPTATEDKQVLYFSGNSQFNAEPMYSWQTMLSVADKKWALKILPSHQYIQEQRPILAWIIGSVGIVVAAMLQVILLAITAKNNLIKQRIDEQTLELSEKNREIAKSEARYVSVVNSVKDIIFQTDLRGNWIFLNPAWHEITGFTVQESVGQPLWNYAPAEDKQYIRDRFTSYIQGGHKEIRREIRYLTKDGEIRWFELVANLRQEGESNTVGTSGTLSDITERKQMHVHLQLAASVFTHANEGILITTTDFKIVDVNGAFTTITGYSKDEVIGKNPSVIRSSQHNISFFASLRQGLKQNGKWNGEVWNRRKNGEIYAEMLSVSEVRNDKGELQNYIAIFSDITVLKNQQQQLEHIAHYDPLTSLPNRLLLADRINQAIAQVARHNIGFVLAYIDIDGFKQINDNFGHAVGDQLLKGLAKNMGRVLRNSDTLARIGGDEFIALLLDFKDIDSSAHLIERLLAAAETPLIIGNLTHQVSASIGVTYYPQESIAETEQLLSQADRAMYQAKLAGKNRYRIFSFE